MTALILTLAILLVAIVNLWIIRRTKAMRKRQPYVAPTPLDAPITLGEAARYCEGDTILCKPQFLHYALTQAYEVEDDQLGLFVGYAKADPQHDATILVQSSDGQLRGLIASQPQLYEQLIASRAPPATASSAKPMTTIVARSASGSDSPLAFTVCHQRTL